jgi:hypothetical protein
LNRALPLLNFTESAFLFESFGPSTSPSFPYRQGTFAFSVHVSHQFP